MTYIVNNDHAGGYSVKWSLTRSLISRGYKHPLQPQPIYSKVWFMLDTSARVTGVRAANVMSCEHTHTLARGPCGGFRSARPKFSHYSDGVVQTNFEELLVAGGKKNKWETCREYESSKHFHITTLFQFMSVWKAKLSLNAVKQRLHHTIRITIHGSRCDYIVIYHDTVHIVIFLRVQWKCLNRADKQVVVYDLGGLNTSHHIIMIIQWKNWVKTT